MWFVYEEVSPNHNYILRWHGTPVDINMDKKFIIPVFKITVLESSNFKTIDKKKNIILKDFGKVKNNKDPSGIRIRDLKIHS